jgi:alpha-galactosidase
MRESLGEAYLVSCGAPVLPALGLCDGMRIGPDIAGHWNNRLDMETLYNFAAPGTQNALRTSLNRLWLQPLVHTDPDVVYFRSTDANASLSEEHKLILRDLALVAGSKGTSDLPRWLTPPERLEMRLFLAADPPILRLDRYRYRIGQRDVDFAPHIQLPAASAFEAGHLKRFIQQRSESEMVLNLARGFEDFRQKMGLMR